jgi:hypothetical protein
MIYILMSRRPGEQPGIRNRLNNECNAFKAKLLSRDSLYRAFQDAMAKWQAAEPDTKFWIEERPD